MNPKSTHSDGAESDTVKEPVQLTMPAWVVSLTKLLTTAIVTIVASVAIGYARFYSTERTANEAHDLAKAIEVKLEAKAELITQITGQLDKVDLKQSLLEKSITESLARIETNVKDLRADVKELQSRPVRP